MPASLPARQPARLPAFVPGLRRIETHTLDLSSCHPVNKSHSPSASRIPPASLPSLGPGKVLRAEMGAQWIQSATGNPITALAKKMGLPIGSMNSDDQQYTATGKAYTDSEAGDAEDAYSALEDARKEYTDALKSDMSLDAAYRKVDKKTYLTPYVQVWLSAKFSVWRRDDPNL